MAPYSILLLFNLHMYTKTGEKCICVVLGLFIEESWANKISFALYALLLDAFWLLMQQKYYYCICPALHSKHFFLLFPP